MHQPLADGPLGLWRLRAADGPPPEEQPVEDPDAERLGVLAEFAGVYRQALETLGLGPREVDALEVWEAATLLGVGNDDGPAIPGVMMLTRGSGSDGEPGVTLTHDDVLNDLTRNYEKWAAKVPGAE